MKVISIIGRQEAGRAALVERLVRELAKRGPVGTIVQAGEESMPLASSTGRHLDAGAETTIGITPTRSVETAKSTDLNKALGRLSGEGLDFAVVEGFERSGLPKIAIGDAEAENIVARVGGDAGAEELAKIAMAQPEYVTLEALVARIKRSPRAKEAGAIGTFTGMVREVADSERTEALEFESFDEAMRESIRAIEEDLKRRKGILEVIIYHKTGRIEASEDIVFIVILSGHREELFPALRDAIERVKAEVPIWKKEFTASGGFWVHDVE